MDKRTKDQLERARKIRPKILKLARRGRAMDEAFKAVRKATHPDADAMQISELRAMFFAGAAEMLAIQMYGVAEGGEVTDEDQLLFSRIADEVQRGHNQVLQLALATYGSPS